MDGERRKSLNLNDKEFVTAQKTCHDKDRITSHVAAKIFALVAIDRAYDWSKFFVGDGKSSSGFHNVEEIYDVFSRNCE
jgi:hypothetical protein